MPERNRLSKSGTVQMCPLAQDSVRWGQWEGNPPLPPPPRLAPELRPEGAGPESGRGHCRIVDLGLGRKDSSVGGLLA